MSNSVKNEKKLSHGRNTATTSDHKRKLIAQIKKGITGKIAIAPGELIFTRPKVG